MGLVNYVGAVQKADRTLCWTRDLARLLDRSKVAWLQEACRGDKMYGDGELLYSVHSLFYDLKQATLIPRVQIGPHMAQEPCVLPGHESLSQWFALRDGTQHSL